MKPGIQATGLVAIMFVLTLAMGLGFGSAESGGGGSNIVATTVPPKSTPAPAPKVIVVAMGVNPSYLYQSSFYSPIPSYMFEPLSGVHVALESLSRPSVSFLQRVPPITLRTNASGMAYVVVAPGNYSILFTGPNFSLNTNLTFTANTTNTIRLNLDPAAHAVIALHLVSPDTVTGVEPVALISALLGNQSAPHDGFAELVGAGFSVQISSNSSLTSGIVVFNQLAVNATVIGSYPETNGNWAVLSPLGSYQSYPTSGLVIFQFMPVLQVNSTGG
jgi:hypothetical protein